MEARLDRKTYFVCLFVVFLCFNFLFLEKNKGK